MWWCGKRKMAEFVSEENRKQCKRERESGGQGERVTIGERERVNKFVPGDGFVVGVGGGEMRCRRRGRCRGSGEIVGRRGAGILWRAGWDANCVGMP